MLTPASIEADCATLVESLATLLRCARVSFSATGGEGIAPPPALVPAVAERLIASAASLAGAAAELRRRAALADVARRVACVRALRGRLSSAAEVVQRELDEIADEVAEAVTALDLHLASSALLPAPRGSPLEYRASDGEKGEAEKTEGDRRSEEERLTDELCASLGGYFQS